MHVFVSVHACLCECACMFVQVCMHVCASVHAYLCECTCMFV